MPDDAPLPFWPRFLSRVEAARYVGVGVDTFAAEVASGLWPAGRPRGGRGGKLTWDRTLLDRAADRQAGIEELRAAAAVLDDAAAAAVERRIDGQTQRQWPQHRHQAKA